MTIQILAIASILLLTILGTIHAQTGKYLINKKPKRRLKFITTVPEIKIYNIIYNMCSNSNYSVEYFDPESRLVLISEDPSFFHGGYFYPIYLEKNKSNELEVQVFIKSKWGFPGFLTFRCHRKVFYLLKLATIANVD